MSDIKLDSRVIDDAVWSIKSVNTELQLQINNLQEVMNYIETGLQTTDTMTLIDCVKHTKNKLNTANRYIKNAAKDINSCKGLIGMVENIIQK